MAQGQVIITGASGEEARALELAVRAAGLSARKLEQPPAPDMYSRPEGVSIWLWCVSGAPPKSEILAEYPEAWGGETPLIAAVADAPDVATFIRLLELGFDAVLPRPVDADAAHAAIKRWLAAEKRRRTVVGRSIVHGLRQPLTVLMGYAELAGKRIPQDAAGYGMIDGILEGARELQQLLDKYRAAGAADPGASSSET